MFHVILYQPQIPQNTGNIGRLCAITNSSLHLIHPLGFSLSDRYLKRSGMDYWQELNIYEHTNWDAFLTSTHYPKRIWLFTTQATRRHWDIEFEPGDGLLFGNEGNGAPTWLHEQIGDEHRVTIPQFNPSLRSINLATSVGIGLYEALRQN